MLNLSKDEIFNKMSRCRKICGFMLDKLIERVQADKKITDTDKSTIIQILNKDTYFVGGIFRSIFNNDTFNDVDVAFRTKQASDTMFHLALKYPKFFIVSNSWNSACVMGFEDKDLGIKQNNPISLNFNMVGAEPLDCVYEFDASINRNYFVRTSGELRIDQSVFSKVMEFNSPRNVVEVRSYFKRLLRFISEGYQVSEETSNNLLYRFKDAGMYDDYHTDIFSIGSLSGSDGDKGPVISNGFAREKIKGSKDINLSLSYSAQKERRPEEILQELTQWGAIPRTEVNTYRMMGDNAWVGTLDTN